MDANDNPSKQAADIQDLIAQGVDILLVSPAKRPVSRSYTSPGSSSPYRLRIASSISPRMRRPT